MADRDQIVIENSGDAGLTILTGTASSAWIAFGDSGDADAGYLQYEQGVGLRFGVEATTAGHVTSNGKWFIGNETSNVDMVTGITIQQATADDEILAFKSSDVAHGVTTVAETDTWCFWDKITGARGGMRMTGIADSFGGGIDRRYCASARHRRHDELSGDD